MYLDRKSWEHIRLAMHETILSWIYDPNVMFVDYGWRERGGTLIKDELCIRLHVLEKIAPGSALDAAIQKGKTRGQIPDTIANFPIDVQQESYQMYKEWWRSRWRQTITARARRTVPMQGGISISNHRYTYATLGGLVLDRTTNDRMILSNWHVLAGDWRVKPGWPIYQPGWGDGGSRLDVVATYTRGAMSANLDAAVAKLNDNQQLINNQFDLAPVRGVSWAKLGMDVVKSGRRTNVTYGRVTGVEGVAKMKYCGVYGLIRNVMTIMPHDSYKEVSAGGDSGSFWLQEKNMHAVGLHFAGYDHPERAWAIDMQPVLDALNVDINITI